jgi:hypothetical protein
VFAALQDEADKMQKMLSAWNSEAGGGKTLTNMTSQVKNTSVRC